VTVQVSQISTAQSSLFPDTSIQNISDSSFQNLLEQEQQRMALMFSPWGGFNFGSLFAYPEFLNTDQAERSGSFLFGMDITSPEHTTADYAQPKTEQPTAGNNGQSFFQSTNNYFPQPAQATLQEILLKTGWLTPNLEASPLFYRAQLEGKMLNKLDLQALVDQIVTQLQLVKGKGKTELTIGLRPEELGNILLTLTSKSGMISIHIQAPEETRKLLEALRLELEMALKKSKVNLAEIKIDSTKEVKEHA
jgi:flagellar hook-length control protein FliK